MQLVEDRVGGGDPLERLAVRVVGRDEMIDALHQLFDAGERAAADGLVGDQREEALDLVQPRAVGRDEVHVPARLRCQPGCDLRVAMGGWVIADAVDVQFGGHGLVDLVQKGQELLVPVARLAGRQHGAARHVQRREQRGCTVALVVVGNALDMAKAHGQHPVRCGCTPNSWKWRATLFNAPRPTAPVRLSVCLFSSRCLRSQRSALAGTINVGN